MASFDASLPLYERVSRENKKFRAIELFILSLFVALLVYRVLSFKEHGLAWVLAFLCEVWFTFNWAILVSTKWNQVHYSTHPQRLLERKLELPSVDMFVTTTDPVLEPPIITVNTVLSLLAIDYPIDKLACYMSDDGGSPLTFYSLVEALKFAKLWVPFCKKYNIQIRAPFRYFTVDLFSSKCDHSTQFIQDWQKMKNEYEQLSDKIDDAAKKGVPCDRSGEFSDFLNTESKNHPTIIKVIWENQEGPANGVPHLVYVSREKRPKHPHHHKAGAMNVLARVSAVMTNAPIILNVDCDMYVNNPQTFIHAMCLLLGIENERECAFVQCPQQFYNELKDDPFGNQFKILQEYMVHGMVGIQGPGYFGTGCFHRRKVIYGLSPFDQDIKAKLSNEALRRTFGRSLELRKSIAQILLGTKSGDEKHDLNALKVAYQVATCDYEYDTTWGKEFGWIYGSTTEDILTGITIHGRGWKTTYCTPKPDAFLGCAPFGGPEAMTQTKRWATGLLEILLSYRNPIFQTIYGKLQVRMCLTYTWILLWALWSIPELCYALLPAYCIITDSHFLPKVEEAASLIPICLFMIYNLYILSEYLRAGLSAREWWNNLRMWRGTAMNAFLFGAFSALLNLLGVSKTVFEITRKDQPNTPSISTIDENGNDKNNNAATGRFTFDDSPVFIPGTTVLLVNLIGLATWLLSGGSGIEEVVCSLCVVLLLWAFLKGLFGKGKYGIPLPTLYKSGALSLLFVNLSIYWSSWA